MHNPKEREMIFEVLDKAETKKGMVAVKLVEIGVGSPNKNLDKEGYIPKDVGTKFTENGVTFIRVSADELLERVNEGNAAGLYFI